MEGEGALGEALEAVWAGGGAGGGGARGALRAVARCVAARPGLAAAAAGPRGRSPLHAFAAGLDEDDPERGRLLTALLGLGADPDLRDDDGWAPADSSGVGALQVRWREWATAYGAPRPPLRLLLEGPRGLGRRQVLQALWLATTRADVGAAFDVPGFGAGQTPLHLVCRCLQSEPGEPEGDVLRAPAPQPPKVDARSGQAWGSRAALLRLRAEAEAVGSEAGAAVEPWTDAHELLTLLLDIGADCGSLDQEGRRPEDLCPFPSVRRLLRSDWALGDLSKDAFTVTPEGDVVDTRNGAVVIDGLTEDEAADTAALEAALEGLCASMAGASVGAEKPRPVRLVSSFVAEAESFYARRGRAEEVLREWRARNAGLRAEFAEWPREDARRRLALFAAQPQEAGRSEGQSELERETEEVGASERGEACAERKAGGEGEGEEGASAAADAAASEEQETGESEGVGKDAEAQATQRAPPKPDAAFEPGYEYELDYA